MKTLLLILLLLLLLTPAHALILVHKGNSPTTDRDWPPGSLPLANLKSRAGFWEGPPFGGGRFVFEYAGDAPALQEALDLFSQIKSPDLRLIIHDGQNKGFFFNDKDKPDAPGMDWSFTVWTPANFHRLYGGGPTAMISAADPSGLLGKPIEPPTLDVYLGSGRIDWKLIKVPANLKVTDERASANGYAPADGSICRGRILDMATSKPIANATITLADNATAKTDATGNFEIKNIPPGNHAITVTSDAHAPRILGHATFNKDTLKEYTTHLAPSARISGVVRDQTGKPLPNITVRAQGITALDGSGYILPDRKETTTAADGSFEITGLPAGALHLVAGAKGYAPLDILTAHKAPGDNLDLRVTATGGIKGRVLKPDGAPDPTAQIAIYPEGGPKPGKWSASSNLDANASFSFDGVPPGKYTVSPHPARHIDKLPDPAAKTIEIKAGEMTEVEVTK